MSYLRARKSVKLGPGVRLNLNKKSVGLSVGPRGARISANSNGRRTTSVGIPGSGLSYITTSGGGTRSRGSSRAVQMAAPPGPVTPGLFSAHYEKAFAKGVRAYLAGDRATARTAFVDASHTDTKNKAIGDDFFAGLVAIEGGSDAEGITYLEQVVGSERELPDDLMRKYAPGFQLHSVINESITIMIPGTNTGACLLLADAYDRAGRTDEAIGVLQQLIAHERTHYVIFSLAVLYRKTEAWDELVHVAAGITNEDDLTLLIRLLQAEAMSKQGLDDAALEVLKDVLRSKKRDPEMLKQARYARADLYLELGKNAMAKRDFSRIYADDPTYQDVSQRLSDMP